MLERVLEASDVFDFCCLASDWYRRDESGYHHGCLDYSAGDIRWRQG